MRSGPPQVGPHPKHAICGLARPVFCPSSIHRVARVAAGVPHEEGGAGGGQERDQGAVEAQPPQHRALRHPLRGELGAAESSEARFIGPLEEPCVFITPFGEARPLFGMEGQAEAKVLFHDQPHERPNENKMPAL